MRFLIFHLSEKEADTLTEAVMEIRRRVLKIVSDAVNKYDLDMFEASNMHLALMLKVIEILSSHALQDDESIKASVLEAEKRTLKEVNSC